MKLLRCVPRWLKDRIIAWLVRRKLRRIVYPWGGTK